MKLKSLRLQDFRSYADQAFAFEQDRIIFCGENGIGKTNVLEAISVLSVGKSWREQKASDLVKHDADSAQITACDTTGNQYQGQLKNKHRRFLKNEKALTRTHFIGQMPTLLFCPEYLHILTGPKAARVLFFDRFLIQCNPLYREALTKAAKAHKHKTALLKSIRANERPRDEAKAMLHPWNQMLAETLPIIHSERIQILEALNVHLVEAVNLLVPNPEPLKLGLLPAEDCEMTTSSILQWFDQNRSLEILTAKNYLAAQRDDFGISLRDKSLGATASRGEVRTTLLALLHAQKNYLQTHSGIEPILLLDDVFSELDDHRQGQLETLCQGSQTFFTTTHMSHFDRFKTDVQVFQLPS